MSGSNKIKASSVAAFLFMPQFNLCFQHFAHIKPVFIRTLAMMFEQAGLITKNHPATRYGIEGVRNYKASELLGEAWFTLRTTQASPHQWATFVSIVLMVVMLVATVVTFILRVVLGVGSVAQAQIFDHPGDPYGAGVGVTDLSVVPANAGAGLFDKAMSTPSFYPGAASQDYALMLLDKVLRQAAQGTGAGAPLQEAIQALLLVYNTGMMVVAAVILFWIVLSVVVDTAKTGIIGGGRHNMVWAPIRIIFALGLLIPLGAVGFSSGQYMVIKLAEWGSNFGSRGWTQYVSSVNDNALVSAVYPKNVTGLMSAYAKAMTCYVAYNSYLVQAGVADPDQFVTPGAVAAKDVAMLDTGNAIVSIGNEATSNLCGTVTFKTSNDEAFAAYADYKAKSGIGVTHNDTIMTFKQNLRTAYANALFSQNASAVGIGCGITQEFIYDAGGGADPTAAYCGGFPACGAGGPNDGQYPDNSCLQNMVSNFYATMTASMAADMAAVQASLGATLLQSVANRGWAGMGLWYHEINKLNMAVQQSSVPDVTVGAGEIMIDEYCNGHDCSPSSHTGKVRQVLETYDRWWRDTGSRAATGPVSGLNPAAYAQAVKSPSALKTAELAGAVKSGDGETLGSIFGNWLFGDTESYFMFDLIERHDPNVYPIAELSATGQQILLWAMVIFTSSTLVPTVVSLVPIWGEGIANALGNSSIMLMVKMAGLSILSAGIVLAFWIPLLPFIRVAFSALTWIISVFEAVVMVPVAALAHLTTEGEGISGGGARTAWILWLNILLRPILTVFGYVGAMLVFNSFVLFFHDAFTQYALLMAESSNWFTNMVNKLVFTIVYVGVMYMSANMTFKMVDIIPNALMRWMGGSPDQHFEDTMSEGFVGAMGGMIGRAAGGNKAYQAMQLGFNQRRTGGPPGPGGTPTP